MRRGQYGEAAFGFIVEAAQWMQQGDSDERLLAIIEALRINLDPTRGGCATFGDIAEWHARLADRAAEILSDSGDWEPSE